MAHAAPPAHTLLAAPAVDARWEPPGPGAPAFHAEDGRPAGRLASVAALNYAVAASGANPAPLGPNRKLPPPRHERCGQHDFPPQRLVFLRVQPTHGAAPPKARGHGSSQKPQPRRRTGFPTPRRGIQKRGGLAAGAAVSVRGSCRPSSLKHGDAVVTRLHVTLIHVDFYRVVPTPARRDRYLGVIAGQSSLSTTVPLDVLSLKSRSEQSSSQAPKTTQSVPWGR